MHYDFESIIREYGTLLSRVAATYEANRDLQQELLQEICLAVWQGLQRFEAKSSVKTYILRIAHNRAVTHVSREAKEPHKEDWDEVSDLMSSAVHRVNRVDIEVEQQQAVRNLVKYVRQLPVSQRQVMTLSLEGLSYQEIAEICGLTVSNVGVLITRAKQQLKSKMHAIG